MTQLQPLVQQCLAERVAFRQRQEIASSACYELFQRAFGGEEAAWTAIFTQVFPGEIRRWVAAAARVRGFSAEEIEEAIQETRLAFWRYAPQTPTLGKNGDLAPIIDYLKKCAMSAVAMAGRKLPPPALSLGELRGAGGDEPGEETQSRRQIASQPVQPDLVAERAALRELIEEVSKCLENDLERLVAQQVFVNDTPPRQVVEDYPEQFLGDTKAAKLDHLNQILQTIRRRLRKAPIFQTLPSARRKNPSAAFLRFSLPTDSGVDEAQMPSDKPCPFDDVTLLDYLRGAATPDTRLAIEQSHACIQAARALAADLQDLTPLLRLALCPEVDTLIDYYHKRLRGAQQLVLHNHVQGCRQCQAEVAMFAAMDEVPVQEGPSLLRRLIEAFFLPPTLGAAPVRGALPHTQYRTQIRTPAIDILIFTQKSTGKARTWTMRGELRTAEGLQFTQVEKIVLRPADPVAATTAAAVTTTLDEEGMFVMRGLEAGVYALHIFTNTEEILIRALQVGEEP